MSYDPKLTGNDDEEADIVIPFSMSDVVDFHENSIPIPYLDADEIIREARESISGLGFGVDADVPDVISTIEDALKVVDSSNLPPAPVPASRRDPELVPAPERSIVPAAPAVPAVSAARPVPAAHPAPAVPAVPAESEYSEPNTKQPVPDTPGSGEPDTDNISKFKFRIFDKSEKAKKPKEFKVNFDFESAYKDPPEDRPLRRRRERRTGLVGGLMFAIFILCIGLILASIMWMATIDVLGFNSEDETVDVYIPADFDIDSITDILYESGLIRYKALFGIFAEYSNADEKIKPGSYVLNKNYDYRALVQGMTARSGIRVETTVVIPEGLTLSQIFTLLEREEVCTADELWDAAARHDFNFFFLDKETLGDRLRLEGFLFPDTYNFYKESTAVQAITKMLREFNNKFTETYVERADFLGYTVREIVIIASMIEREAGSDEERSRISAVIHNRLNNPDKFPMLEIDATINYARAGTGIAFSTQWDNEFNTYMYPGLPPGPIASPGLASLQAALYPIATNEYFYALNKDGTHNFFTNAADHINFVNSDQYGG